MTFCETLKKGMRRDGREVIAERYTEKNGETGYRVIVSRDGVAERVIAAARTTYRRRYAEAVAEG